jgi:hypothetical protein
MDEVELVKIYNVSRWLSRSERVIRLAKGNKTRNTSSACWLTLR